MKKHTDLTAKAIAKANKSRREGTDSRVTVSAHTMRVLIILAHHQVKIADDYNEPLKDLVSNLRTYSDRGFFDD